MARGGAALAPGDGAPHPLSQRPASLRTRLTALPAVIEKWLWPAQIEAIRNLEVSFSKNRPRALIQMATGSGKTFTAVSSIYRLIKDGDAKRVLFLVDRANLGRQALTQRVTSASSPPGGTPLSAELSIIDMIDSWLTIAQHSVSSPNINYSSD